jgi:UDP-N-acetyl-2-amino-2-deoxyglucuronate dehydrogenase
MKVWLSLLSGIESFMSKINIAIIGCGRISAKHFQAIYDNSDSFNLVAICDTNQENLSLASEKYNVPGFNNHLEMLSTHPEIDVVSICTPSGLHPIHSMDVSRAGKHVITEKPMSCTLEQAVKMVDVAEENKVKLFVVKQNRLNPTVHALKSAIDSGSFGKIFMIHCNVFWTRPQEYYDQATWRGTWELDGGALMNQSSHYIDLLEWFGGPVKSVQAITKTLARNIEAEDSAVVNFEWQQGCIGSMAVSMLTYPNNLEGSITILGEKGTVRLDGIAMNEVKIWHFENPTDVNIANLNYQPTSVYGNGHGPYYKNVADVLLHSAKPISDGASGLKSIKLLTAIYQASKSGETVKLDSLGD